jgi:hypothetical protein
MPGDGTQKNRYKPGFFMKQVMKYISWKNGSHEITAKDKEGRRRSILTNK